MHLVPRVILDAKKDGIYVIAIISTLDEGRLIKYVGYLSLTMQTIDSVKMYCGTVCDLSEIRGYGIVHRGWRFYKTILWLRKKMVHEIKQAKPTTISQLKAISHLININDQKQLNIWVAMLFGFFVFEEIELGSNHQGLWPMAPTLQKRYQITGRPNFGTHQVVKNQPIWGENAVPNLCTENTWDLSGTLVKGHGWQDTCWCYTQFVLILVSGTDSSYYLWLITGTDERMAPTSGSRRPRALLKSFVEMWWK